MNLIISENFTKLELILPPVFHNLSNKKEWEMLIDIWFCDDEIDYVLKEPNQNIKIKVINSVTQETICNIFSCVRQYEKE